MLFISHALPEDNEFTRWLALRLAKEGYPVWCDLTNLLGGEDFWRDIQDAIQNRATKFLFVHSRNSNDRPGVLQELALAKRVGKERHDFVIPLKIDDLSNEENQYRTRPNQQCGFLSRLDRRIGSPAGETRKRSRAQRPAFQSGLRRQLVARSTTPARWRQARRGNLRIELVQDLGPA